MIKRWVSCVLAVLAFVLLWVSQPLHAVERQQIQLVYATFDPLLDGEPAMAANLTAASPTPYALLQLTGPMQPAWAADFTALGVTFYGYLPEFAYLVRLPENSQTAVSSHGAVRWLGAYHPAYRLSPTLVDGRMLVQLFADVEIDKVMTAVSLTGASLLEQNETADLLTVQATAVQAAEIATIDGVMWLQSAVQMQELNDDARWVSQGNIPFTTPLYDRGLTGAGQVGGVGDSGLSVYDFGGGTVPSCFLLDDGNGGAGGTTLAPSVDHRKVVGYTVPDGAIADYVDGSGHGSHVVGSIVGDRAPWGELSPADGQAYQARIFFQDIGMGFAPAALINPPSDYRVMFGEAYDPNGDGIYQPGDEPRTHSNSWGSAEPTYSIETMQTDEFMWTHPDFLIFFAAGNQGPAANTIGYPATAKNIVTVAGTENGLADPNSMGYFSGHGPAPFGRMKPTVSAPGDRVTSVLSGNPCGTTEKSGTSMATPTVHGITLLMRQYLSDGFYPTGSANPAHSLHPSAALLKAMLMNSGRSMSGAHTDNGAGGSWPSYGQGWGRVTADDVLYFTGEHRGLWLHDEYALDGSAGFDAAGQTRTFTLTVGNGAPFGTEPLEITLAWADYPGLPPAGGPLVNNLDLTVIGPDGAVHVGNDANSNDFNGLPDLPAVSPDVINPWEVVYLAHPQPGEYTITVTAGNLASMVLDATRKQGFALVATGDILSEQVRAEIEHPQYEANPTDVVRLRVTDLAASGSVTAVLSSDTAPNGRTVTLMETKPNSGVFVGAVTLNEDLAVSAGDTVRLAYAGIGDTAVIAKRPLNFINPPQTTPIDNVDEDNSFIVSWQPAEETANLGGYVIQQSTTFALPLYDDAEGPITDNWTTGPIQAQWSASAQYARSGANSYWSGRGDVVPLINSALSLNRDIVLPATLSSARLGFYSRYFNDFNDYGHVEISADGGPWTSLRRLYADPRLVPLDGRLQYHEFDLSEYIGTPIRVRFRYDNGVFSAAPDSPGWWLDDISISGGVWQTVATTGPETTSASLTVSETGSYFYRVRALYHDGSVSGWSNVAETAVSVITPPPSLPGSKTTGGGWLDTVDGKRLDFGFQVRPFEDGWTGNLTLNDRGSGPKIQMTAFSFLGSIGSDCDGMTASASGLMFEGSGTFNGGSASFRVCVEDNAEPGQGSDRFYLECLAGCSYNTAARAVDNVLDSGNIQVLNHSQSRDDDPETAAASQTNDSAGAPSTLILDPLLLDSGLPNKLQPFTVRAYDANQNLLPQASVTLVRTAADGTTQSWTLVTDGAGTAVVNIINLGQTAEYTAVVGNLSSNSIQLVPLPYLPGSGS